MRLARQLAPHTAVLILSLVLAVTFVLGLSMWFGGEQIVGTVLMLLAAYAAVYASVVLGCFVLAGLPREVPFAERNLPTSRLAWTGRSLWGAIVLAAGGYFGAIIATDLSFPTPGEPHDRIAYLVSIAVLLGGFAAVFVVVPIVIASGMGILRAGRRARSTALRKTTRSFSLPETWVEHLASPVYAWAALAGFLVAVPLTYALVFWTQSRWGCRTEARETPQAENEALRCGWRVPNIVSRPDEPRRSTKDQAWARTQVLTRCSSRRPSRISTSSGSCSSTRGVIVSCDIPQRRGI